MLAMVKKIHFNEMYEIIHTTVQRFRASKLFSKENNTFINQGSNKLIRNDS